MSPILPILFARSRNIKNHVLFVSFSCPFYMDCAWHFCPLSFSFCADWEPLEPSYTEQDEPHGRCDIFPDVHVKSETASNTDMKVAASIVFDYSRNHRSQDLNS